MLLFKIIVPYLPYYYNPLSLTKLFQNSALYEYKIIFL
jgi:hypothetical protein